MFPSSDRLSLRLVANTGLSDRSSSRSPRTVVAWLTGRRAVPWGVVWGVVFGAYIAESAIAYQAVGATEAARHRLAETWGANHAMAALYGPPLGLDTVSGFTAWRALGFLSLVGAVIGLLLGSSALRGEEEAGRWEILLAGQTTCRGAARQALAGLGAGLAAMFLTTTAVAVVGGRWAAPPVKVSGLLEISLSAVLTVAVFTAVGVLAGQMVPTRRQAAAWSAVVFGAAFLIRVAAESSTRWHGVRWLTPLSWPSLLHAATGLRLLALLPPVAAVAVLVAASLVAASRRDLDASVLPDRCSTRPRTVLLGSHARLSLRLMRAQAVGWLAGLTLLGFVLGLVAESDSQSTTGSHVVDNVLNRLGAHHIGAEADLGLSFLIVAVLVACAGATAVTAIRTEEARGLLDNLLVRSVGRTSWLSFRVAIAAVQALGCGLAAGLAAWGGAAAGHAGIGLGAMTAAGVNAVPPALFLIGLGTLIHAVAPRATARAIYVVLGWSFLVEILGSFATINHWVLDTSILHHSAPAPAADPNWDSAAVLTLLGALAAALGAAVFRRRDLTGQ